MLRPGGRLLFVELGKAPEPSVSRWQHRLTPLCKVLAGGCHLDRPIDTLIRGAGFAGARVREGYARANRCMLAPNPATGNFDDGYDSAAQAIRALLEHRSIDTPEDHRRVVRRVARWISQSCLSTFSD